jgi:2-polyprenyl-3-methyl-5-hydroxy-6-metoxy-1,4-benzoquinol methylase
MDSRESSAYESRFDLVYGNRQMAFGDEPEPELRKHIESDGRAGRALDLGCGDGRHTLYLARQGYNVTGLDISSVGINKLQKLAKCLNLYSHVNLIHIDA